MHEFFAFRIHRSLATLALLLGILAAGIATPLVRAQDSSDEAGQAKAEQLPGRLTAILALQTLAERGSFDEVLETIRTHDLDDDARAKALAEDIKAFSAHKDEWKKAREKAYGEAIDKLKKAMADGKIEDALYTAIEARGYTHDHARLLTEPVVKELVGKAEARAAAAVKDNRWLDQLATYRALDLLFDGRGDYGERLGDVERRLYLIRVYAPEEYARLSVERAKRQGEEDPEAPHLGQTTWKERLVGVTDTMLREAVYFGARKQVDQSGYAIVLGHAFDAMILFAETPELAKSFEGLKNAKKTEAFIKSMKGLKAVAEARADKLTLIDTMRAIEDARDVNKNTIELPEQVLLYEMANGAVSSLDDFSAILWPYELQQFISRNLEGKFVGVGIKIEMKGNRLTVISPLEGTPAHKAGILSGDVIERVDGKDARDWTINQAVREITGEKGTKVVLGVRRPGEEKLVNIPVTRDEIVIKSVEGWKRDPKGGWDYFVDPKFKIGYIRISQFIPQTDPDLVAAINEMDHGPGLNGLILDLRGNPGGLLQSAVDIADRFVDSGPIVSTEGPDQTRNDVRHARRDRTAGNFPVVVLINEGTASASEIVSGAIQDHGRGVIVGMRSFGKGSVQDTIKIDRGRARLKLTTQYYKLPKGRIIHRRPGSKTWGVEPDLVVPITDHQFIDLRNFRQQLDIIRNPDSKVKEGEATPDAGDIVTKGLDPQLESALLIMKTRILTRDLALAAIRKKGEATPTP